MSAAYDAIVVGARCAGSPTAMLLARLGLRVLVVDRATFPSDTLSTHVVQPQGIAALARWGLRDALVATGCPAIHTYAFDFGPVAIAGAPGTCDSPVAFAPRRTVLDKLLVDAAAAAGAEIREGFSVEELVFDGDRVIGIRGHGEDGATVTEHARIVIGADGRNSSVARAVRAAAYKETPPLLCGYYAYWSGLPMEGRFETYIRERRGFAAAPTHDGLTMITGGWPYAEFEAQKHDLERNFEALFELVPSFAERMRGAKRETRVMGVPVAGWFRTPYGPGWALVGDAGYNKDYITAQGISDAFRDAELVSTAIADALSGARAFDAAMEQYRAARDAAVAPMYDFTCMLASLEPPPPEMQQLLAAIAGKQPAMDAFAQLNAGVLSPPDFFARIGTAT